ncbi:hypothetical protein L596_026879 [Steinernema carpocapsae]|uniref:Uncharacterized protein n=1 Tax=Steinernema carpocapsae TaxID=34508 RepID=A0A4U5M2N2_STECR|nr:hypothetical protein L596_026879 [Steinernema carpocapsae]
MQNYENTSKAQKPCEIMTQAAKQHKMREKRPSNPKKAKKLSYPTRVAEVVAGLFKSFRKVWRQPSPYQWCRRATVAVI